MKINERSFRQYSLILMFLFNVILLCSPGRSSADTLSEYVQLVVAERFLSFADGKEFYFEQQEINWAWQRYLNQHKTAGVAAVGQVSIDGLYPTALYDPNVYTMETLSFLFIDPFSGLPATSFPSISSVFYEVSDDPDTNTFTALGTATDSISNFSIMYSISGFEPIIRATPLDAFGNPIVISGVNSENVTIGLAINIAAVPVPAAAWLFGSGLIGLIGVARKKAA